MAELSRAPVSGESILAHFLRLREDVRRNRLLSVTGGRMTQTEGGVTLSIPRVAPGGGGADPTSPVIPIDPDPTTPGELGMGHCYAFEAWANNAKTGILLEPGDIMFGPGCPSSLWIEWGSISGASQTPAVSSSDPYVWLEINVSALTASMAVGSKAEMQGAITGATLQTTMIWPLVVTTWAGGVITKVKNLQCGNVVISRAAG